jgi:hypothetical protein
LHELTDSCFSEFGIDKHHQFSDVHVGKKRKTRGEYYTVQLSFFFVGSRWWFQDCLFVTFSETSTTSWLKKSRFSSTPVRSGVFHSPEWIASPFRWSFLSG